MGIWRKMPLTDGIVKRADPSYPHLEEYLAHSKLGKGTFGKLQLLIAAKLLVMDSTHARSPLCSHSSLCD